jgi:hypothetical protein
MAPILPYSSSRYSRAAGSVTFLPPGSASTVSMSKALRSSPTLAITRALPGTTPWANWITPRM